MNQADELLAAKLNLETARMPWAELERFFAAGKLIVVAPGFDLLQAAVAIARDDQEQVGAWIAQQTLAKVSDAQAGAWSAAQAQLWTVVVSPWILVQAADSAVPATYADTPLH